MSDESAVVRAVREYFAVRDAFKSQWNDDMFPLEGDDAKEFLAWRKKRDSTEANLRAVLVPRTALSTTVPAVDRNAVIEECAKVCEHSRDPMAYGSRYMAGDQCATVLRALKTPPTQPTKDERK